LVGVLLAAVLGGGAYVAGTRGLSGGAQDSRETAREPDAGRRALPPPIEPPPPPPAPAPWLEWVGPAEGAVVRARRVEVAGRVADLRRGRLTVGGVETTVGADGGFATHVDVTTPGPLAVHVRFEPTGGTRLEDVRTVTVEFPPPVVTVRRPAEGERLPSTTVDVEASVEPSETAVVTANGRPLTLVGSTARGTVTLHDHGPGRITVEAKAVGVPAVSRSVDVVVEPPPAPVLAVVEPRDGAEVEDGPVRVSGTVRGAWKDVVRVNGASIRLVAGAFSTTVEPADLGPLDVVVECDADGRPVVTRTVQVDVVPAALGLEIDAPAAGDFVTTKTLRVRGTIRGAPSGPVLVGGVVASVRGTEFTADVPVGADGPTTVVATARRRRGPDARAEVAVVVDRTPPRVVVEDPAGLEGTATKDAGRLRGRVHDEHATAVQVDDRSFDLDDGGTFSLTVPVAPGKRRTVVLRARDRAGNESKPVRVEFRGSGPRILSVPGEFATVAAAVEAAQAGETVEIGAGTYREQIVVRRPVTLAGAGRDTVRIEAAQTDVPVIRVARTKDVVVRGLTVVGRGSPSDASSDLDGVTWTKDWAPTVDMVEPGSPAARAGIAAGAVLVRVGDRAVERLDHLQLDVLDRSIRSESFDQPLRFSNGAVATVRYRRVSWAMRIDDAEASLQDVAFEATSCGALLVAGPSASARIHEVRIESGEDGIYVGGGAFAQIRDGRFSGLDGAAITAFGDRTRVRVADCVASRLRGAGFRVMGAVAAQVERCRATECVYGLDVLGPGSTSPVSANVDVSACTFSRNRVTGINFDAVAVGTIEGNTCEDNAGHGIDTCGAGTRPLIRRNTCRRNGSYGVVH
jgi:parallel beta-helix repeat protein